MATQTHMIQNLQQKKHCAFIISFPPPWRDRRWRWIRPFDDALIDDSLTRSARQAHDNGGLLLTGLALKLWQQYRPVERNFMKHANCSPVYEKVALERIHAMPSVPPNSFRKPTGPGNSRGRNPSNLQGLCKPLIMVHFLWS